MNISKEAKEAAIQTLVNNGVIPAGYHIQQLINSKDERIRELEKQLVDMSNEAIALRNMNSICIHHTDKERRSLMSECAICKQATILSDARGLVDVLTICKIASCTCITKTPDPKHHKDDCRYKTICNTIDSFHGKYPQPKP